MLFLPICALQRWLYSVSGSGKGWAHWAQRHVCDSTTGEGDSAAVMLLLGKDRAIGNKVG